MVEFSAMETISDRSNRNMQLVMLFLLHLPQRHYLIIKSVHITLGAKMLYKTYI